MKTVLTLFTFFIVLGLNGQNHTLMNYEMPGSKPSTHMLNSLNGMINSPFPEVRPYLSPDGLTLYFGRREHPENHSGSKDPQDIWFSTLSDRGIWREPKRLASPINDKWANGVCNISPDGKIGVFYDMHNAKLPLVKSYLTKTGWSEPNPIVIEDYYNHNEFVDFYVSFESKVMLMAIERVEGVGGQDLFVSHLKNNGSYSAPINLGSTINSENADYAPFLSEDGQRLFFVSSDREGGFGSCDIYMSKRLDDSWQSWSEPVNLGKSVNSEASECFFSISPDFHHIYVDTAKPGVKDRNIRVLAFPEELKPRNFQAYIDLPKSS